VTAHSSRFVIALLHLALGVLGAGFACGLAAADGGMSAYKVPGTGGGAPPQAPSQPAPVIGRVIATSVQGNEVIITIGAGFNAGVRNGWTAKLLRVDSDDPLPGGKIKVIRVDKAVTVGRMRATVGGPKLDDIQSNRRVKLSPP
jgi:hypothetical protein